MQDSCHLIPFFSALVLLLDVCTCHPCPPQAHRHISEQGDVNRMVHLILHRYTDVTCGLHQLCFYPIPEFSRFFLEKKPIILQPPQLNQTHFFEICIPKRNHPVFCNHLCLCWQGFSIALSFFFLLLAIMLMVVDAAVCRSAVADHCSSCCQYESGGIRQRQLVSVTEI